MKSKYIKGFTLVELLVVITILAILFTIGFISFKNYVKDARDGGRVADISNVTNGLEITNVKLGKYPDPDKKDGQTLLQTGALSISGSIIEYSYLGVVGDSVTKQLSLTKVPQDPLTGDKYIYTKTIDGRKYQVASILENPTGYKNNLVKQANAGNDGYVAKVEGNHKDIVIQQTSSGKFITVVPSLVFDTSGSNILNQTGTLSIVNNKGNLPYSPSKSSSIGNTTTAEQLIREVRNNNLATTATLKLPDGVTLDGSGVLNEWWIPNKSGTNWNGYSSGVILASLGSVGVDGNPNYDLLTAVLNGKNPLPETTTAQVVTAPGYNIGNSLRFNGSDQYLTMTPNVVGNGKIGTIHTYFKGINDFIIMEAGSDNNNRTSLFLTSGSLYVYHVVGGVQKIFKTSSALFRDPSTWYDVVLTWDMPVVKLYVNGVEISSWQTSPNINTLTSSDTFFFNTKTTHNISKNIQGFIGYLNGYISDYINIDGQALSPTSFGQFDTNGRWVPKAYTGSYGTNGFHLDFSSGASLTSLGLDSAPIDGTHTQANNWTLSPTFNTYDQMLDSPTNNFATWNLLNRSNTTYPTISNGLLQTYGVAGTYYGVQATMQMLNNTYWEMYFNTDSNIGRQDMGIVSDGFSWPTPNADDAIGRTSNSWVINCSQYYTIYRPLNNYTYGTDITGPSMTGSSIMMFAYSPIAGAWWVGVNGTWLKSATSQEISNLITTNSIHTGLPKNAFPAISVLNSTNKASVNFGQGGQTGLQYCSEAGGYFKYCPPAGFKALSTKNITYPIENPKQYFDVLTYTGNNTARTITGLTFKPDLVWIKNRDGSNNHIISDSVRGIGKYLSSNNTSIEQTNAQEVTGFNNDGISIGTDSDVNWTNGKIVAWNWRAGGTAVINNDGTIQSQVNVNKEAGFSIVSYTGNNVSGATVGHGLTKVPNFIIWKDRDAITNWRVYHSSIGVSGGADISTNGSFGAGQVAWTTAPTSSGFTISGGNTNGNLQKHIAYVWSEVPGYSKFGSYVGNNTIDGPFIYTGFKPKYLMIKNSTTGGTNGYDWVIYDGARNQYNPVTNTLWADLSAIENNSSYSPKNGPNGNGDIDFLSNGFKIRSSASSMGGSDTYIYAAFAELPFK